MQVLAGVSFHGVVVLAPCDQLIAEELKGIISLDDLKYPSTHTTVSLTGGLEDPRSLIVH